VRPIQRTLQKMNTIKYYFSIQDDILVIVPADFFDAHGHLCDQEMEDDELRTKLNNIGIYELDEACWEFNNTIEEVTNICLSFGLEKNDNLDKFLEKH